MGSVLRVPTGPGGGRQSTKVAGVAEGDLSHSGEGNGSLTFQMDTLLPPTAHLTTRHSDHSHDRGQHHSTAGEEGGTVLILLPEGK